LTTKHAWYTPRFKNQKLHLKPVVQNATKKKQSYQVTVNSYHADNGAFRSETFQKSIDNKNQKLHFSGVNAQWQSGLVERSNDTLCAAAR
jgi:IS30 family transposase